MFRDKSAQSQILTSVSNGPFRSVSVFYYNCGVKILQLTRYHDCSRDVGPKSPPGLSQGTGTGPLDRIEPNRSCQETQN
ncbi:hypothetical protein F2P81_024795 [Scophthalmus maximus]|uniref:Uncharacterized protein n=1 Tax=Scophthalmus maximus TaxID=52904 RepID=A0A6A4RWG9_SCOMX|nr:hypothetical protein F2P81_024795 [Scophthalmus maximus]